MHSIQIANRQQALTIDRRRIRRAVLAILRDAGVNEAQISIAIVDDPTILELNRRYLQHDYETDVLSFVLEQSEGRLEGEVIASAQTATRLAGQFDWTPQDELLLYIIHGTLHLVGYDDIDPRRRKAIRASENQYLALFGLKRPD